MNTLTNSKPGAAHAHQVHYDSITKLKLKQREDEGTLKQTEARLEKLEEQLPGLTVQKEYAAKEVEIALARKGEEGPKLEDAILTTIHGTGGGRPRRSRPSRRSGRRHKPISRSSNSKRLSRWSG